MSATVEETATPLAERECEAINDQIEIHFWPTSDPAVGTPCKCGRTARRRPRWVTT